MTFDKAIDTLPPIIVVPIALVISVVLIIFYLALVVTSAFMWGDARKKLERFLDRSE